MTDLQPLKSDRSLLVEILTNAGCIVKGSQVRCAFHNSSGTHCPEKHPSGSIIFKNNAWLYRCHGPCNDVGDCFHWVAVATNKTDSEVLEHFNKTGELLGVGRVTPKSTPPPKPKEIPYEAFARDVEDYCEAADDYSLTNISFDLGVSVDSLRQFRIGRHIFADDDQNKTILPCITIPMYDTIGRICGIRYRAITSGKKKSRYLSRNGIFIPTPTPFHSVLWIAEGCTDPLALTSIGLWAIGLPAASQGIDAADAYVEKHSPQAVVAIADANKAGRASATLLCRALIGRKVTVKRIEPPDGKQDVRGWINDCRKSGLTDAEIKSKLLSVVGATKAMKGKTE